MQQSRFVILTGHLKDYPLSDLVGILRHQQKTGRLLIEYPKGPAVFYFRDGELVDAQLDNLSGLQAVCVAVAQPASSFNFNPLIQPPKRTIENSMQRVVSELLGCWDEHGLEIDAITPLRSGAQPAVAMQPAPQPALLAAAPSFNVSQATRTDQALVFSSVALQVPKSQYSRPLLAIAAVGLLLLGISTVIALTRGFPNRGTVVATQTQPQTPAPATEIAPEKTTLVATELPPPEVEPTRDASRRTANAFAESNRRSVTASKEEKSEVPAPSTAKEVETPKQADAATENPAKVEAVRVVLRIENGRVAEASIANHKPGNDAVEALALRIARQRRYPAKSTGAEMVVIKVAQSN
jgi:hypothetical protein